MTALGLLMWLLAFRFRSSGFNELTPVDSFCKLMSLNHITNTVATDIYSIREDQLDLTSLILAIHFSRITLEIGSLAMGIVS